MASPSEYMALHAQVRQASASDIVTTFQTALQQGIKTEDLVVALTHIDEALVPDETRDAMAKQNVSVGCMLLTRIDFADAIKDFVHPTTGARCYEKLSAALQEQTPNHFYVAVFHSQNASLTKVLVDRG